MDIYFCDECAARVSDAELSRGHGIKKEEMIFCGHCLEKGLGRDLLHTDSHEYRPTGSDRQAAAIRAQASAGPTGEYVQKPLSTPLPDQAPLGALALASMGMQGLHKEEAPPKPSTKDTTNERAILFKDTEIPDYEAQKPAQAVVESTPAPEKPAPVAAQEVLDPVFAAPVADEIPAAKKEVSSETDLAQIPELPELPQELDEASEAIPASPSDHDYEPQEASDHFPEVKKSDQDTVERSENQEKTEGKTEEKTSETPQDSPNTANDTPVDDKSGSSSTRRKKNGKSGKGSSDSTRRPPSTRTAAQSSSHKFQAAASSAKDEELRRKQKLFKILCVVAALTAVFCYGYIAWKGHLWPFTKGPIVKEIQEQDPRKDFEKYVSEVRNEAHAATKSNDPVVVQKAIDRLMKLSEEANKVSEAMKNLKQSPWNDTQVGIYFDNTVKLSDVLSMKMTLRKNLAAISDQPPTPPTPPEPERRD